MTKPNTQTKLHAVTENKFRRKCEKAAESVSNISVDVDFDTDSRKDDDAFKDDGCLHVRRHGIHAMFSIGEDTDGHDANAATRTILEALGMKRKIGPRTLVSEECEECGGDGYELCELGGEHHCSNCDGSGFVEVTE